MATLRNLAISALRTEDHNSIATALRHMARNPTQPLTLLGTTPMTSTNNFAGTLPGEGGGRLSRPA